MKVLIIYSSRYGATREISELLAINLKLKGFSAEAVDVADVELSGEDFYLLGSGIYANKFLPEMEEFIYKNENKLASSKVGLFGVAMRTEPVERNGRMSGGVYIFERYPIKPFVRGMLHGRMDFSKLTEEDRGGLERFYNVIGLSEEEKSERRKLRDEISEEECASFADEVAAALK